MSYLCQLERVRAVAGARRALPVWIGGRADAALERTGRLADGYRSFAASPEAVAARIPVIRAAAEATGRLMPTLSARVRVAFDAPVLSAEPRSCAMRGSSEDVATEVAKWSVLGVELLALHFEAATADQMFADAERSTARSCMVDGLSPGDLATLSLLDPQQGVCPNGHGCRFDPEPGFRSCGTCDYRGMALICWEITQAAIVRAASDGADRRLLDWARAFVGERGVA